MEELKTYIVSTENLRKNCRLVFLTRTGQAVIRLHLNQAFNAVCKKAKIKKITPDSLRGIYRTFIEQGYSEYAIMHSKKDSIKHLPERIKEFENKIKRRQKMYNNLINRFPGLEKQKA